MGTITERATIKTIKTHYIDGAFVESHGREVMDVIKPTNGQVIARATLADEEDTRRAVAAAKRAFATYSRSTKEERAKLLRRLHAAAAARVDQLTAVMVEEYGGVVQFARIIVESGVAAFQAAEKGLEELPLEQTWGKTPVILEPVGVAGFDHRLERERAVYLLKARLGRRRRLYRGYQAQRVELAADPSVGRGAARSGSPQGSPECGDGARTDRGRRVGA
jgi:hypothetical protein